MGSTIVGATLDRTWTADQLKQEGSGAKAGDTYCSATGINEYVFVSASSAIAANDCVAITNAYAAAPVTKALADAGNKIGVAQIAIASGSYGWVQTRGVGSVNVLASAASGAALYTTATAGKLDDTATSQTLIESLKLTATNGGSTAAVAFIAPTEMHAPLAG